MMCSHFKGGYTHVTLPRIVTPYRDSVDVQRYVARPHLLRPYRPFDVTAKYRQHTEQARDVTS